LRRRTDKVAACLAALLVAVFLTGAPVMSIAAVGWPAVPGPPGRPRTAPGTRFPLLVPRLR